MARRSYIYDDPTFPIQVRPDLVIRIHPMPHDLSQAEADKICRVVQAMVLPTDAPLQPYPGHIEDEE
jgi:hypothetical protein